MTDERMDARLRGAGERWRATTGESADAPAGAAHLLTEGTAAAHRPRRAGLIASVALVAAAVVAGGVVLISNLGGGTDRTADTAALRGTVWQLLGDGNQKRSNSSATLYISPGGQLVADDECEVIGAKARLAGNRLHVSEPSIRYRSCTDSVGEVTFTPGLGVLLGSPTVSVDGDQLTLRGAGRTMHLRASRTLRPPVLDVPTFVATDWQLVRAVGADGHDAAFSGKLRLRVDGDLTASDGCNTLSGALVAITPRVRLADVSTTEIGCPEPMPATAVIDAVFSGSFDQVVNGARLTLTKKGAGTLTYVWVPSDTTATDPANLVGRTWHLASVAGDVAVGAAVLRIGKDGTVSGSDGCAQLGGRAVVGHGTLAGVALRANQQRPRQCAGRGQATTVDSFLDQQPAVWSIRDGKLLIYGGGAQAFALVYASDTQAPLAGAALIGRTWALTGVEHSSGNASSGSGSGSAAEPGGTTVVFDRAGRITITHRCYVNAGDVAIGQESMDIAHVDLARAIPCPATPNQREEQKQDAVVDGALTGHAAWAIQDGDLRVTNGDTALTFSAKR